MWARTCIMHFMHMIFFSTILSIRNKTFQFNSIQSNPIQVFLWNVWWICFQFLVQMSKFSFCVNILADVVLPFHYGEGKLSQYIKMSVNILCKILGNCFSNNSIHFMNNSFRNRFQRTNVENIISPREEISPGTPQGSIY